MQTLATRQDWPCPGVMCVHSCTYSDCTCTQSKHSSSWDRNLFTVLQVKSRVFTITAIWALDLGTFNQAPVVLVRGQLRVLSWLSLWLDLQTTFPSPAFPERSFWLFIGGSAAHKPPTTVQARLLSLTLAMAVTVRFQFYWQPVSRVDFVPLGSWWQAPASGTYALDWMALELFAQGHFISKLLPALY